MRLYMLVVATGSRIFLDEIQNLPQMKAREFRALLKAGDELGCRNLMVLTKNEEFTEEHSWYGLRGEIQFVPLWRWLLQTWSFPE